MPDITYVDDNDHVIGSGSRLNARSNGIAHRIARVFVFNSRGELLIQKRAPNIGSPNKWDQSAAGHVDAGEDYLTAAKRELAEEVGISNLSLREITKFYAENHNGPELIKRFNTLYVTEYDGDVRIDEHEVSEVAWVRPEDLEAWMQQKPADFTRGFVLAYGYYHKLV